MKSLHIQNARIIDPSQNLDGNFSLWIKNGKIAALTPQDSSLKPFEADQIIPAQGLILCPGLIDLDARLNSIEAELEAAVAGGITSLVVPPDTDPPLDEPELADRLVHRAKDLKKAKVLPLGALTLGLNGEQLSELAGLKKAGCVAFSQASRAIINTEILRRAMEYAASFGFALWVEPQDYWLSKNGSAHSGVIADRLGLSSIPIAAETIAIATFLALLREIPWPLHVHKLSSQAGVQILQNAIAAGLSITFDVDIHHLLMTDSDTDYFNTQARFNPPLRSESDKNALCRAIINAQMPIVSAHAPVGEDDKLLPFDLAKPGATGLEVLLPLTLQWAKSQGLTLMQALAFLTQFPAKILKQKHLGTLNVGAPADCILFHPQEEWTINSQTLKSRGKNSPFLNQKVNGKVHYTMIDGRIVYSI